MKIDFHQVYLSIEFNVMIDCDGLLQNHKDYLLIIVKNRTVLTS